MSKTLSILTFHAIEDNHAAISFSPRVFAYCIARLSEFRYRTIHLLDAVGCLKRGENLPDRSVAITFDDGYRSVYEFAFPVLRKFSMTATVFLTVGDTFQAQSSDRLPSQAGRAMLNWVEIREMQRAGFHFGAHSLTHPDLTKLSPTQIEREMQGSKEMIEQQTGARVDSFAYPFGKQNAQCRAIARRHFSCACTDRLGVIDSKSDLYALQRIDAYYLRTGRAFELLFSKYFPAYIRALSLPRGLRRAMTRV